MFKIAVIGCGVVGSGVAEILIEKESALSLRFNEKVELSKILDIRVPDNNELMEYFTENQADVFDDEDIKLVVITVGGTTFAKDYAIRAFESGKHVVTSNKELVAAFGRELTQLAFEKKVRFLYEASAGGGIPIISPINICLSGNDFDEIIGILNGTTNYILTKMRQENMDFSDALSKAQAKGYAETDPTDDVEGHDAARKIAILSSLAYDVFVDYRKIKCKGISSINAADHELAGKAGFTIKLVARSKKTEKGVQARVEPVLLSKSHMLSGVDSVYNAVFLRGNYVGDSMFYGRGAGKLPTASAVVGDIITILDHPRDISMPAFVRDDARMIYESKDPYRFFIRFTLDKNPALGDLQGACKKIFGMSSQFSGNPANSLKTYAVITGFMSENELERKLSEFEKIYGLSDLNYIKVID